MINQTSQTVGYTVRVEVPSDLQYECEFVSQILNNPLYHIGQQVVDYDLNSHPDDAQIFYVIGIRLSIFTYYFNDNNTTIKPEWVYLVANDIRNTFRPYHGHIERAEQEVMSKSFFDDNYNHFVEMYEQQ